MCLRPRGVLHYQLHFFFIVFLYISPTLQKLITLLFCFLFMDPPLSWVIVDTKKKKNAPLGGM